MEDWVLRLRVPGRSIFGGSKRLVADELHLARSRHKVPGILSVSLVWG